MTDYSHASPFSECQAILAAIEDDTDELDRLLGSMLPGELASIVLGAERLAHSARRRLGRTDRLSSG